MGKSILRMARSEKHMRLFELIRQDTLAQENAKQKTHSVSGTAPDMQALQRRAQASIQP